MITMFDLLGYDPNKHNLDEGYDYNHLLEELGFKNKIENLIVVYEIALRVNGKTEADSCTILSFHRLNGYRRYNKTHWGFETLRNNPFKDVVQIIDDEIFDDIMDIGEGTPWSQ